MLGKVELGFLCTLSSFLGEQPQPQSLCPHCTGTPWGNPSFPQHQPCPGLSWSSFQPVQKSFIFLLCRWTRVGRCHGASCPMLHAELCLRSPFPAAGPRGASPVIPVHTRLLLLPLPQGSVREMLRDTGPSSAGGWR